MLYTSALLRSRQKVKGLMWSHSVEGGKYFHLPPTSVPSLIIIFVTSKHNKYNHNNILTFKLWQEVKSRQGITTSPLMTGSSDITLSKLI